jgi:hypothetical protein
LVADALRHQPRVRTTSREKRRLVPADPSMPGSVRSQSYGERSLYPRLLSVVMVKVGLPPSRALRERRGAPYERGPLRVGSRLFRLLVPRRLEAQADGPEFDRLVFRGLECVQRARTQCHLRESTNACDRSTRFFPAADVGFSS